jgi:DNA polymerase elongation subunit (family B)
MTKNNNSIEFQIYDWMESHEQLISDDGDEELPGDFIINTFGRTQDGKSVYAKVIGYTPYFYFLLPEKLQNKSKNVIDDVLKKMQSYFKSNDNKNVYYLYKHTLREIQPIRMKKAEGFTNNREFWFGRMVFTNADGMKKFKNFLENKEISIPGVQELAKPHKFKLYEANLPPMFRCFHIRDITGCSWVETYEYNLIEDEEEKESRCDIEIIVDWRTLNPIKKENNAPLRICSFDIECYSIDGEFPQAKRKGDEIIQIGATYTYIGQSIPYRQFIACLDKTSNFDDNTIVVSCDNETELMMAFIDEINNNDCDIITGYNIFFFDENYMYERCKKHLNLENDIAYISKLKNYKSEFITKKLASSALGENILKYWNTPGRIHIDLMKDVQKTFNLPSYKLDYVASKFIRGEVSSYKLLDNEQFELVCKSVSDISIGDYIHLEVVKGFVSDEVGEKYLVLGIDTTNKKIIVKGDDFLLSELDTVKLGGIINWSQAKDDVGPKDIFKLQKGTPEDRAIVAKYCVKDCKLVNLLINKLEVVTKNIEMANVCSVPLSYLFSRGQGIKLFSLCLKEFRKQKIAFPVLKVIKDYKCSKCNHEYTDKWECPKCRSKEREEIESEDTSYEGAIVFDPVPEVIYESLATKDYRSLYPSSIMHKNMSHETIVEDTAYDNLPGVKYYNAQFKENDGSIQYRRFAQVDGKLGVIPTILDNLLKERDAIKALMKKEKDIFKYKILDAKQLAVKITANSLYGQLGASTSPVCKRDIAACTTSTGREMLILAKKYDEEFLPWIINGLKHFYNTNQLDKIEYLYDLEIKSRNDEELLKDLKKFITQDINNLTFQPVIKYGDTDSIFSCYRFRENTALVSKETALKVWKKVVGFAKELIEPFFGESERQLFIDTFNEYYSDDKIVDLQLPEPPICLPEPSHHAIVLPIEERIKQFVKEYMQESYIPWLWTLAELVEKNYTFMFNIKLTQWAEHQLSKIRLIAEDLYENRKNYLMNPLMEHMKTIFVDKYVMPNDKKIKDTTNLIKMSLPYSNEINIELEKLNKMVKNLMEKTIKEKWIYSSDKKELVKTINKYLDAVVINKPISNPEKIHYYLINFISENKNLDITSQSNLLVKNLMNNDYELLFDEQKLENLTPGFIEEYHKNNGKKSLDEIMEDFIQKELLLKFDLDVQLHYQKVIHFINNHMRKEDMTQMDVKRYDYYWIQPRWDFDMKTKKKLYMIDIYDGGKAITDKRTLDYGMEMGKLSGETIKSRLPFPHDCEYEKTFWPFAILTKKRYVGNKYEMDPNKFKQDFMGIVLKRRDNAPIVKEICGGIIDYLINHRSPEGAKDYTIKCLDKMFNGKYDIKYFLTSKTLKSKESYKDWKKIAHVYLAEKIAKRDPGNTPQSGDRIEFAVIKVEQPIDGSKLLQGDMIETPLFIKQKKLELDYLFYLTNQIMNPALQFLELVDKNAINIFRQYIEKYSAPKIKKQKKEPIAKKPKLGKPIQSPKKTEQDTIDIVLKNGSGKKSRTKINISLLSDKVRNDAINEIKIMLEEMESIDEQPWELETEYLLDDLVNMEQNEEIIVSKSNKKQTKEFVV